MSKNFKLGHTLPVVFAGLAIIAPANAAIFVKIPSIPGEVKGPDNEPGWFQADTFSFGVERDMKESGEKGGTEDINIGIGELQECTISKSADKTSPKILEAAVSGRTVGDCEIAFCDEPASGEPVCYLHYVMERCYVKSTKSWSTSGDADDRPTEEVAFYFNKIAFGYSEDGVEAETSMGWDQERDRYWMEGENWLFDFEPSPR